MNSIQIFLLLSSFQLLALKGREIETGSTFMLTHRGVRLNVEEHRQAREEAQQAPVCIPLAVTNPRTRKTTFSFTCPCCGASDQFASENDAQHNAQEHFAYYHSDREMFGCPHQGCKFSFDNEEKALSHGTACILNPFSKLSLYASIYKTCSKKQQVDFHVLTNIQVETSKQEYFETYSQTVLTSLKEGSMYIAVGIYTPAVACPIEKCTKVLLAENRDPHSLGNILYEHFLDKHKH